MDKVENAMDKVMETPIIGDALMNPLFTGILIVIVMLIIVLIVFRNVIVTDDTYFALLFRTGLYALIPTIAIVYLNNRSIGIQTATTMELTQVSQSGQLPNNPTAPTYGPTPEDYSYKTGPTFVEFERDVNKLKKNKTEDLGQYVKFPETSENFKSRRLSDLVRNDVTL